MTVNLIFLFILSLATCGDLANGVESDSQEPGKRGVEFITGNKIQRKLQSATGLSQRENQQSTVINPRLSIDMRVRPVHNESLTFIRISNRGEQDEFVEMTVFDNYGQKMHIVPSQFPLERGASAEIPLPRHSKKIRNNVIPPVARSSQIDSNSDSSTFPTTAPTNNMITVLARGKRNTVKRSFIFGDPYDDGNYNTGYDEPFCFEKDVTGTCRYRDDPSECFRWHWTAYATILNYNGGKKITSIPEGLFLDPGEHGRVRVYLKVSCCTPIVQFISTDIYHNVGINSCVIDVRELQALHPGEIAGIVVGVVAILLLIILVIILCLRRRRKETINNVGILPRISSSRSRTRSKDVIMTARN